MTASLLITLAGFAVCAWAFMSLVQSPARGDWLVKLTTLAIFGTCLVWTLDRLFGDWWRWDGAFFLAALALHLWVASPPCALFRHLHDRRAAPPPA